MWFLKKESEFIKGEQHTAEKDLMELMCNKFIVDCVKKILHTENKEKFENKLDLRCDRLSGCSGYKIINSKRYLKKILQEKLNLLFGKTEIEMETENFEDVFIIKIKF